MNMICFLFCQHQNKHTEPRGSNSKKQSLREKKRFADKEETRNGKQNHTNLSNYIHLYCITNKTYVWVLLWSQPGCSYGVRSGRLVGWKGKELRQDGVTNNIQKANRNKTELLQHSHNLICIMDIKYFSKYNILRIPASQTKGQKDKRGIEYEVVLMMLL